MKNRWHIVFIISLLMAGCTESVQPAESVSDDFVSLSFSIDCPTRVGGPDSTTYRAMLLDEGNIKGEYPYTEISGTYRGPNLDGRAWLTACKTDSVTGIWQQDGHLYGLRAIRDDYYLSFVSPGVAPQQYQYDTLTSQYEKWGFFHRRERLSGEPELFISSPYLISLTGNHLDGDYAHDVPSGVELRERRAKLTVKVRCGQKLQSAKVGRIGWVNLYDSAYYNLALDTLDNMSVTAPTDTEFVFTPSTPVTLLTGEDTVICRDFFVFPFDYTREDQNDEYVYEIPELIVDVVQGVVKVRLIHDIKAQYSYTYTLTVNSAYVTVSVSAAPWNDIPSQSAAIQDPPTFLSNFSIQPWNTFSTQTGTI